jgi:hypothetical protein
VTCSPPIAGERHRGERGACVDSVGWGGPWRVGTDWEFPSPWIESGHEPIISIAPGNLAALHPCLSPNPRLWLVLPAPLFPPQSSSPSPHFRPKTPPTKSASFPLSTPSSTRHRLDAAEIVANVILSPAQWTAAPPFSPNLLSTRCHDSTQVQTC